MSTKKVNQYTAWTAEEDALLIELAKGGCSLNEAAATLSSKFGKSRTRNSTVSRARRIGARWQNKPPSLARIIKKVEVVSKPAPAKAPVIKLKPIESIFGTHVFNAEDKVGVAFLKLKPHHCRWPLGEYKDKAERFCGESTVVGQSFCPHHYSRAYVKPRSVYQKETVDA